MICNLCKCEIEYDEGEGNIADGRICYSCIDERINDIEELKIRKSEELIEELKEEEYQRNLEEAKMYDEENEEY